MPRSSVDQCPNPSLLGRYATGSLVEERVDELEQHVADCPVCRRRLDRLVSRKDSLVGALRRGGDGDTAHDPSDVERLIEAAGRGSRLHETGRTRRKAAHSDTVALDSFTTCLRRSGLIEDDEIDDLVGDISPDDSGSFAKELVSRGKLTGFQAGLLVRGRWKGLVLGNYEVLDRLGRGGMGNVFRARHRKMGREVCLKVLNASARKSPEMVERFRREARTVAAMNHPNIVVAHDADQAEGLPFLVMELIDGRDLARIVHERGPLPVDEALRYTQQAADALSYAHRQGVVHRDVKPHNLLVDETGAVKVLDMGLARFDSFLEAHSDASTAASMTNTGVVMGTVDYMSPEQALNSRKADSRSDIYSLGCTLYFLLAGKPPYPGETLMEKLVAHREQPVPSLCAEQPEISKSVDAVLQRMIAKRPDERYADMGQVVADLDACEAGRRPAALPAAAPPPIRRPARRSSHPKWLWWSLGAAAAVSLLTVGIATWNPFAKPAVNDAQALSPNETSRSAGGDVVKPQPPPKLFLDGGPGRVAIVLPFAWFYEDNYTQLKTTLEKRGVEIVTVSSQSGSANPKHRKIKPVPIARTIGEIDATNFDAVIFIGGNVGEFKYGKFSRPSFKVVNDCLQTGRVVAAVSDGAWVLDKAGAKKDCTFASVYECQVGCRKDHTGRIVIAGKRPASLTQALFDKVLPELKKSTARKSRG